MYEINVEDKEFNEIMLELGFMPKFIIRINDNEILHRNDNGTYSFKSESDFISHQYYYAMDKKISNDKDFKVTHWIKIKKEL